MDFFLICIVHSVLIERAENVQFVQEVSTNLTFVSTNLTFVSESGRSRKAIGPELKGILFLHRWTWTLQEAAH